VFLLAEDAAGWRQLVGCIALILNTVVELALARIWLDDGGAWPTLLSLLVLLTSRTLGQGVADLAWWMQGSVHRQPTTACSGQALLKLKEVIDFQLCG